MVARKKIQLAEVSSLPIIKKGNHLTVTTFPDGRTELEWDWDALVNEVREATASIDKKPNTVRKAKAQA